MEIFVIIICKCLSGIGFGGQLILFYSCMTYIIILSWALLYLVFSFSSQLPWASCNNDWNTGKMQRLFPFSNKKLSKYV